MFYNFGFGAGIPKNVERIVDSIKELTHFFSQKHEQRNS